MEAIFSPLLLLVQAVVFLAPGLAAALWLRHKRGLNPLYVLLTAALISSAAALVVLSAYLIKPVIGEWLSIGFAVTGWASTTILLANRFTRSAIKVPDIALPFILMISVALAYHSISFTCQTSVGAATTCYSQGLPMDNILPQAYAANVAAGTPTETLGDWRGSDRPPLQSAILLSLGPLTINEYVGFTGYQLLATLLQCLWIPALWILLRNLRVTSKRIAIVLGLCVITGFFFFNSVFVWPKLLAASLAMLAFCLLLFERPRALTWTLGGAAAGLAMLAHSGVAFTLIPLAIYLLVKSPRSEIKLFIVGAVAACLFVIPWTLYQKFYDGPGDRLAKWHLAGQIDSDERSLLTTAIENYGATPVTTIVANKLRNFQTIVGAYPPPDHLYGGGKLAALRDTEFRYIAVALVVFNAGWIALCFASVRKSLKNALDVPTLKSIFIVLGGNLILWALLMFGPASTVVHQGSYLTMLLLFGALGAILTLLPRRLLIALIAAQLAYFAVVWILSITANQVANTTYLLLAIGASAMVMTVLTRISHTSLPLWKK